MKRVLTHTWEIIHGIVKKSIDRLHKLQPVFCYILLLTKHPKSVIIGGRRTIELRRFYYTTEPRHLSIGKLHKFYNYFYPEFVHFDILTQRIHRCQLGRSTKLSVIILCNLHNEKSEKSACILWGSVII